MAHLGIHTTGAPWPFKDMQVGDVVICTLPEGDKRKPDSTAHAYGAVMGRVFKTKKITNKTTGEVGYRIERLEDNAREGKPELLPRTKPGRPAYKWPFEALSVGQAWSTTNPELMSRALSAVAARNMQATREHQDYLRGLPGNLRPPEYEVLMTRVRRYKTHSDTDPRTLTLTKVTITAIEPKPTLVKAKAAQRKILQKARAIQEHHPQPQKPVEGDDWADILAM